MDVHEEKEARDRAAHKTFAKAKGAGGGRAKEQKKNKRAAPKKGNQDDKAKKEKPASSRDISAGPKKKAAKQQEKAKPKGARENIEQYTQQEKEAQKSSVKPVDLALRQRIQASVAQNSQSKDTRGIPKAELDWVKNLGRRDAGEVAQVADEVPQG